MRKRRASGGNVTVFDVSGGADVDDRGRLVNRDIPDDARRSAGHAKSKARSQMRKQKEDAKQLIAKEKELEEKPRRRKRVEKEPESKVRTKRTRKTVGELIASDKPRDKKRAQKRLTRLGSSVSNLAAGLDEEINLSPVFLERSVSEQDFQTEYNKIFNTLGSLCRKLELNMNDPDSKVGSRDVYALMTMYSQMRETIADLRSISDVNTQSEMLINEVFNPYHKTVGEMLVSMLYKIMTHLRQSLNEAQAHHVGERLKEIISEEAQSLQSQFENTKEKIGVVLNASK